MLKHRPYCAQIRSQSSRRRICPLPVPLPRSGGGPSGQIAAYSGLRLGSVTFCASLLGQSAARTPTAATPSPSKIAQQIPVLLSQHNPLFMRISPINPQFCKFSIKKSEILTSHMQKRGDLQGLVKGLFSPAKNSFPSAPLTELKLRAFRPHRSNRGAGLNFLSRPHRAIWGSALSGNLPPTSTLKKEYFLMACLNAPRVVIL